MLEELDLDLEEPEVVELNVVELNVVEVELKNTAAALAKCGKLSKTKINPPLKKYKKNYKKRHGKNTEIGKR